MGQPNQHQPEKQAVPHSTEPFFFLTFFSESNALQDTH